MWVVQEIAVNKDYVSDIISDNGTLMVMWQKFY
jgi:hypothetical protein